MENSLDELDINKFDKECKRMLIQKFTYEWKFKLKENSKLNLYDQIKHIFGKEKYLDDIKSFLMRKTITKFRCSDHKLEIEVGRHKKTSREKRVCKLCTIGVETEMHFLCTCPSYRELREKVFDKDVIDLNVGKEILACKEKTVSIKLGNYLQKALKIRESDLDAVNEHERMLKHLFGMGFVVMN